MKVACNPHVPKLEMFDYVETFQCIKIHKSVPV